MRYVVAACAVLLFTQMMVPSLGAADEKRAQPKVGSYWNYEVTDEITQKKWILEKTLTDTNENERVVRQNTRGINNPQIFVFDKNWGTIETPVTKYEPAVAWLPDSLEVGATSSTEATYSIQRAAEWTYPKPVTTESQIAAAETVKTKAGRFETYRVEYVSQYDPLPETPLTNEEMKYVVWFAPRIDHWVKMTFEQRNDGHLVAKTTQTLIEYKVK